MVAQRRFPKHKAPLKRPAEGVNQPRTPFSIKVTAPSKGFKWKGSNYAIQWESTPDNKNMKLSIHLHHLASGQTYPIVENTPNDGVHPHWTLKENYPNGNAKIVLRKAGASQQPYTPHWSSPVFTIKEPFMKVTGIVPQRAAYAPGTRVSIKWKRVGPMDNQVSIAAVNQQTNAKTAIKILITTNPDSMTATGTCRAACRRENTKFTFRPRITSIRHTAPLSAYSNRQRERIRP